jgi:hypothetical protein
VIARCVARVRCLQHVLERFDLQRGVTRAGSGFLNRSPVGGIGVARQLRTRLSDHRVGRERSAAQLQPQERRTDLIGAADPVERFAIEAEIEKACGEAVGARAIQRLIILLKAQHAAERFVAALLREVAVDDRKAHRAHLRGARIALPQQMCRVSACRRRLVHDDRSLRRRDVTAAGRRGRRRQGVRAREHGIEAFQTRQRLAAQPFPLGPSRRSRVFRLQRVDPRQRELDGAGVDHGAHGRRIFGCGRICAEPDRAQQIEKGGPRAALSAFRPLQLTTGRLRAKCPHARR